MKLVQFSIYNSLELLNLRHRKIKNIFRQGKMHLNKFKLRRQPVGIRKIIFLLASAWIRARHNDVD